MLVYMSIWSIVMVLFFGMTRVRSGAQIVVMAAVAGLALLVSQMLFILLSESLGIVPDMALINPGLYVAAGPAGWLALLVMPCGWLGPVLGLHVVNRGETADA
ncbi:MAG TPA: hypothetical protein ENJ93_00420 [Chloroflexi bacterium]|nr:hypothetical protein [Chloroflexota bacterium]